MKFALPRICALLALPLLSQDVCASPSAAQSLDAVRALDAADADAGLASCLPWVTQGAPLANNGEAVALVARALADLGRGSDAVTLLEGAQVSEATRGWILVERARLLLAEDDLAAVVRLLEDRSAAELQPRTSNPVDAWIVLARAHSRAGRHDRAGRLAQGLLKRDPLHPEGPSAWHLVERAHLTAGDVVRAQEARRQHDRMSKWHAVVHAHHKRLAEDPTLVEPRFGMALAWLEVEEIARARKQLEELAASDPRFCRLWFHLGETRRLMGETRKALEAYDTGVQCDVADAKCRFQRAELRFRMGEKESARADFEHLLGDPVAEDARFSALHLRLAQLARERGDETATEVHYTKYRALGGLQEL